MSKEVINEKILNVIGKINYNEYILLTDGKEINEILNSHNPVFEMYKYRDKLLSENVGQDVDVHELEQLLKDNKDIKLRQQLQDLFLDYISNNEFKVIKKILINNIFGWNIKRLVDIHKKHKGYRIFRILSIEYKNWLN